MNKPVSYRSTPIFTEETLPAGLRKEHRTKPGVWGVVRVSKGEVRLQFSDGTPEQLVTIDVPGLLLPDQPHWVTPLGQIIMQVDFYDALPNLDAAPAIGKPS